MEPLGDVTARVASDASTPPVLAEALRVAADDTYAYWQARLAGENPNPLTDRTKLPLGFWRLRSGDPLAVWLDHEGVRHTLRGFSGAARGMAPRHAEAMAESGSFGEAVPEDLYRAAFEAGEWPDDPPSVAPIGHNLPESEYDRLRIEIEGEVETTAPFLDKPIETQADADKCSTWARRVGLLAKQADEAREEEKAPHLKASREVDDKWRPIVTGAKDLTTRLKKHVEPYLLRLKREADEAARKAREEAEQLRKAAEMATVNEDERTDLIVKAQDIERAAAEPKRAIAGRPNMRVSLRTVWTAVIVDYDKAYAVMKTHPDMREFVQALADRACRAKVPVDGVEYRKEERAA